METKAIEKFLRTYSDPALTGLEAAALTGDVIYQYRDKCLIGRHQDGYGYHIVQTKDPLAFDAEQEFRHLFSWDTYGDDPLGIPPNPDAQRSRNLLPLISAEQLRRKLERQQAEAAKVAEQPIEELVCV